mgnify:CR=1 FL=1
MKIFFIIKKTGVTKYIRKNIETSKTVKKFKKIFILNCMLKIFSINKNNEKNTVTIEGLNHQNVAFYSRISIVEHKLTYTDSDEIYVYGMLDDELLLYKIETVLGGEKWVNYDERKGLNVNFGDFHLPENICSAIIGSIVSPYSYIFV